MKIKKIEMTNFKGCNSQIITPGTTNVIIGPTGSGKSTTLDALRYAITGKYPDSVIKDGQKEMRVFAELDDGTTVERKIKKNATDVATGTFKMNGKTTTQKSFNEYIEANMGVKADTLDVITSSQIIGDMDVAKFTDFIMGFVPLNMDFDKCISLVPLSADQVNELSMILPPMPDKFGIEALTDGLAFFEDSRKSLKKNIATKTAKSQFLGDEPTEKMADIDKELTELIKAEGSYKSSQDALRNYNRIIETKANIEKSIAETQLKLDSIIAEIPNEKVKRELKEQLEQLQTEIISINQTIRTLTDNAGLLKNTLDNLDKTVCPISEKLICSTDKTAVKSELTDLLARTNDEIKNQNEKLAKININKKYTQDELDSFATNERNYQTKISLLSKINDLKKSIPIIPAKPEVIQIDPISLNGQKRIIEEKKKRLIEFEAAKKAESELVGLKSKLNLYESIVKLLKPKGELYNKILDFALAPLETHLNARAKELRLDFGIKFSCTNGVNVLCSPHAGTGHIPMTSCSSGEQILITFLIMDLLNTLTGSKILVLDNLDRLDAKSLDGLIKVINKNEVKSSYDHIFLSMVDHDDTEVLVTSYQASSSIDNVIRL